jgi:precorrin-6B methylase 2
MHFKTMPESTIAQWVLLTQIILGVSIFAVLWSYLPIAWGAPWVPSSPSTIRKMLSMAALQPGQVLVDLGAGDGRIVMTAARQFKAQAIGVEIDPIRCAIANGLIVLTGLRGKARVICGNISSYDCRDADVVTLYLLQNTNQKLKEQLSQQLKPGAKVVSHTFSMEGWASIAIDDDKGIFVYEIGNTG